MAKQKTVYLCGECGAEFPKWAGKCPACGEWNTISREPVASVRGVAAGLIQQSPKGAARLLSEVTAGEGERLVTDISEFNLVCGGGLVPGGVILLGGEPGVGKSTMALQTAGCFDTLYISGEESPAQIKLRADRIDVNAGKIKISTDKSLAAIESLVRSEKPELLIVDSIQTVAADDLPSAAGSVTQIRECAFRLADIAKALSLPVILIGHIAKDGSIAGPKVLEHLVDTVLYFEGDFSKDFRVLRAFKNRYGSVNEVGLFRMTSSGLAEVRDKNTVFLHGEAASAPGIAVSAAVTGSRTILFEVQSLVSFTTFPNPRRMADGFDVNRLIILAAVLEKHAGLKLSSFDVFINMSGGFKATEPAADLAVAAAIASSLRDEKLPAGVGLIGEIALSGEIRPVPQCGRRAQELKTSGFKRIICAANDAQDIKDAGFTGEITGVRTITDALNALFGR